MSRFEPSRTRFGNLSWRGGIVVSSPNRRFGGFSGLEISADGKRIIAVSDQGWWLSARLNYKNRRLFSASAAGIAPLLNKKARRSGKKSKRDAESLAAFDSAGIDGKLVVGFERRERVELFDIGVGGFAAIPQKIKSPKAISSGPKNGELESIAHLWQGPFAGWYMAVSERNLDTRGDIRGWRWRGATTIEYSIDRHEDYLITDIAVLPGGREIITLERSFSTSSLPGMALRKFRIKDLRPGRPVTGKLLFTGRQPVFAIDNMEGLAVHQTSDGEVRLTVISDDNYNRAVQSTLIYQFALQP